MLFLNRCLFEFDLFLRFSKMTPGKVTTHNNASSADSSLPAEVSQKDEMVTSETKDVKKPIVSFESDISSSVERGEHKNNDTAPKAKSIDEKFKLEVNFYF